MSDFKYKLEHKVEERRQEANRILNEHPNRKPVICETVPNSNIPPLTKTKYLVPNDMTVNQFQFLIRRTLDLNEISALYLITKNNITLIGDRTMMEIYNIYRDKEDNFLYIYCASELTWG